MFQLQYCACRTRHSIGKLLFEKIFDRRNKLSSIFIVPLPSHLSEFSIPLIIQ